MQLASGVSLSEGCQEHAGHAVPRAGQKYPKRHAPGVTFIHERRKMVKLSSGSRAPLRESPEVHLWRLSPRPAVPG